MRPPSLVHVVGTEFQEEVEGFTDLLKPRSRSGKGEGLGLFICMAFCGPCAPQPELPGVEVLMESLLLGCDFCELIDILLAPCNGTVCSDGNDL